MHRRGDKHDPHAVRDEHGWLPNDNFEVRRLGVDGSSLTHLRQAPGGGGNYALGSLLMTAASRGIHPPLPFHCGAKPWRCRHWRACRRRL